MGSAQQGSWVGGLHAGRGRDHGFFCKVWKGQRSWHRWPSAEADCCPGSWGSCLMNTWCMGNMDVDRTHLLVGTGAVGRYQGEMWGHLVLVLDMSSSRYGGWRPYLWQGSWSLMMLDVPSKPSHSMILYSQNRALLTAFRVVYSLYSRLKKALRSQQ